jgi:hypothetical protein
VYDEVAFQIQAFREVSTRELRKVHAAHPPGHVLEVASAFELDRRREHKKHLTKWVAALVALAVGLGVGVATVSA